MPAARFQIRIFKRVILCSAALILVLPGCRSQTKPPSAPAQNNNQGGSLIPTVDSKPVFHLANVAGQAKTVFTYQNGRESGHNSILESLGGGIALFDFDGDGLVDLFAPGGGRFENQKILGEPSVLFRNLGEWEYENATLSAGLERSEYYSHGCCVGDYDNDGFPDLAVTGYGGVQLFHNQGDGTFIEMSGPASLNDDAWSSSAAWGDLNGDGFLDLYVEHYVDWSFENHPFCQGPEQGQREICPPKSFQPLADALFYSNAEGGFQKVNAAAKLREDGKGLGVLLADVDLDGDLDIYVANDTTDNFLYLNDSHGAFEETGMLSGAATDDSGVSNGSMGVDIGDYNGDGLPDLWAANYEQESFALYRGEGNGQFLHISRMVGVTALGGLYVGFGTAFVDIDRDGDEDLVVANGHVINYPRGSDKLQQPLLLLNQQGKRFLRAEFPESSYFGQPHAGRGLAIADLDNDGDVDLAISNNQEPIALLRNDSSDENGWLRVKLIGRRSNRDGVGAWLVLHTSSGEQLRLIKGGGSYLSQSDLRPFWGVPKGSKLERVVIHWPSGSQQTWPIGKANQTITILEPSDENVALP